MDSSNPTAAPDLLDDFERARRLADETAMAVRRIAENAAQPHSPSQIIAINRRVVASDRSLDDQPLGPCDVFGAEHHLITASGLSGNQLKLAIAAVHGLETAQGVAAFNRVPLDRFVNRRHGKANVSSLPAPTVSCPRPRTAKPRQRRDGSRRHSTRGGTDDSDPHQDDDPAEPTPPAGRRLCAVGGCTNAALPRGKYCSNACRQAAHRRRQNPLTGLDTTDLAYFEGDIAAARWRAEQGCRCNGSHLVIDPDWTCAKCGRPWDRKRWEQAAKQVRLIQAASCERSHDRPLSEMAA